MTMSPWDESYAAKAGLRWWPETELVRFLGSTYGEMHDLPARGKTAVDLGCGTGRNILALSSWGFTTIGGDASLYAVMSAAEYLKSWVLDGEPRWSLSQHVLPERVPVADRSVDLVVDVQTMQHLDADNHQRAYQEVARILKRGGHFFTMHWCEGDSEKLYAGRYPELREWPLSELGPMIENCGFERGKLMLTSRATLGEEDERLFASWYCMSWRKS